MYFLCNYCLQMKLWEGNVFTGVCLSVILSTWGVGGVRVVTSHVSWDRSHGKVSPLQYPTLDTQPSIPLGYSTLTTGGHHWIPVQTCSLNGLPLLPLAQFVTPPERTSIVSCKRSHLTNVVTKGSSVVNDATLPQFLQSNPLYHRRVLVITFR